MTDFPRLRLESFRIQRELERRKERKIMAKLADVVVNVTINDPQGIAAVVKAMNEAGLKDWARQINKCLKKETVAK